MKLLKFMLYLSKGYRLTPWRSPYLKWRIHTAFGIPTEDISFFVFWKIVFKERKSLISYLRWAVEMREAAERRNTVKRK